MSVETPKRPKKNKSGTVIKPRVKVPDMKYSPQTQKMIRDNEEILDMIKRLKRA